MRRRMAHHAELLHDDCYGCEWDRPLTPVQVVKVIVGGLLGAAGFFGSLSLLFLAAAR